jgi:hypothetical protein
MGPLSTSSCPTGKTDLILVIVTAWGLQLSALKITSALLTPQTIKAKTTELSLMLYILLTFNKQVINI